MFWVYYISQIIFLGASFVTVYSEYIGKEIEPNENAVRVEEIEIKN
jgi:membrane protein